MKYREIINFLLRIILGVIFLYASIGKIYEPNLFFKEISNYKVFPEILSKIFAITIPWYELILALFLIFGIRLRTTSLLVFIFLSSFTVLVISSWVRGLNINCGCFSHYTEYVGLRKVVENVILMAFSLYIFFSPKSFLNLEEQILKYRGTTFE
ncbi:MAG: MauE/DoxX family redox-associated membrane protein [Candidatus Kapaibacteriota bacterium]